MDNAKESRGVKRRAAADTIVVGGTESPAPSGTIFPAVGDRSPGTDDPMDRDMDVPPPPGRVWLNINKNDQEALRDIAKRGGKLDAVNLGIYAPESEPELIKFAQENGLVAPPDRVGDTVKYIKRGIDDTSVDVALLKEYGAVSTEDGYMVSPGVDLKPFADRDLILKDEARLSEKFYVPVGPGEKDKEEARAAGLAWDEYGHHTTPTTDMERVIERIPDYGNDKNIVNGPTFLNVPSNEYWQMRFTALRDDLPVAWDSAQGQWYLKPGQPKDLVKNLIVDDKQTSNQRMDINLRAARANGLKDEDLKAAGVETKYGKGFVRAGKPVSPKIRRFVSKETPVGRGDHAPSEVESTSAARLRALRDRRGVR